MPSLWKYKHFYFIRMSFGQQHVNLLSWPGPPHITGIKRVPTLKIF